MYRERGGAEKEEEVRVVRDEAGILMSNGFAVSWELVLLEF